jgi:hypothetical protein
MSQALKAGHKRVTLELKPSDDQFGEHTKAVTEVLPTLLRGPALLPPAKGALLHGALLTNAVSIFEVLIAGIFTEHYKAHPEALDPTERKFSLAELRSFPTISDAEAAAIADRVDQHMRAGLEEWSKWFSKALGCKVEDLADNWAAIEETFQRRHLIVHSGGRVTGQYLAKIPASKAKLDQQLSVSQRYLLRAIDRLSLLGHMIVYETEIKWQPKESTLIADRMLHRCYRALTDRHWPLAERLGNRAVRVKPRDEMREMLRCNAWLAAKRQGRIEEIKAQIQAWDTSAMEVRFKLAKSCLLDELDEAYALVPAFLASSDSHLEALKEWPIFEELRNDSRYRLYKRRRGRRVVTRPAKLIQVAPAAGVEIVPPTNPVANGPVV